MPWTFHRWRACGFWHCSMTAGWKREGMWVLTLHQMFFFSTRKKSQEYFFCFSFNLLPAVIFAAPHFLPVPLAIIFLYLLLFLIRVITCTICGLTWPKSRAMTTIRPLQWVFSFPEAYCQNFMLLQACSVFTATAKSYLHKSSTMQLMFKYVRIFSIHVPSLRGNCFHCCQDTLLLAVWNMSEGSQNLYSIETALAAHCYVLHLWFMVMLGARIFTESKLTKHVFSWLLCFP